MWCCKHKKTQLEKTKDRIQHLNISLNIERLKYIYYLDLERLQNKNV